MESSAVRSEDKSPAEERACNCMDSNMAAEAIIVGNKIVILFIPVFLVLLHPSLRLRHLLQISLSYGQWQLDLP